MESSIYDKNALNDKEPEVTKRKVEVTFYQARFTQKCGAILLDFVVFAFLALALFIGTKAIVESTNYYQEIDQKFDQARLDSGLFVYDSVSDRVEDVVTHINARSDMSSGEKETFLVNAIDKFLVSVPEKTEFLTKEYEDFLLNKDLNLNGIPYFIKDNSGEIIKNPNGNIQIGSYVDNVYKVYIDEIGQAEFVIQTPHVLEYQRYQSNMLLFVEIPVGLCLAAIIVWFIIPLCFTRGKKSLGRLAFRIALLGKDNYSLKFGRFCTRFLIFFFLEFLLSLFTFCVPLIVSLTMSACTKKKQNFHDYMLDIREIDSYGTKIYKDKFELISEETKQGSFDFKMK